MSRRALTPPAPLTSPPIPQKRAFHKESNFSQFTLASSWSHALRKPLVTPRKVNEQPMWQPSSRPLARALSQSRTLRVVAHTSQCQHFLQTTRPIAPYETLLLSAPYAKTISIFDRKKYCQHCHFGFKDRTHTCKSGNSTDYYGFESCRDIFEKTREQVEKFVEVIKTRLEVTFTADEPQVRIHLHKKVLEFEKADLDYMCLFFEYLVKRKAENEKRDEGFRKQVTWGDDKCIEAPAEKTRHVYQPHAEDIIGPESVHFIVHRDRVATIARMCEVVEEAIQESQQNPRDFIRSTNQLLSEMQTFEVLTHKIIRGEARNTYPTGIGLYPISSYLARDSDPNCEFYFDENTNMVITASKELKEGEFLTISGFGKSLKNAERYPKPYEKYLNL